MIWLVNDVDDACQQCSPYMYNRKITMFETGSPTPSWLYREIFWSSIAMASAYVLYLIKLRHFLSCGWLIKISAVMSRRNNMGAIG